jgi:inhibitor of KinA
MKSFELAYQSFGESAILINWPNNINETILNDIRIFSEKIVIQELKGIIDFNFVYTSLLVSYNNTIVSEIKLIRLLKEVYQKESKSTLPESNTWYIPVCYDTVFGLDLEQVAKLKQIHIDALIEMHSAVFYTVYGIGFLPGFLYLGGLNPDLITARKETPRINVTKGVVAIGGSQTGIYPQDSPGGWHIIGKTPIPFFDSKKEDPTFVKSGDQIKFYPISNPLFDLLEIEVETGIYDCKKRIND